jgi:hypothetical protein
VLQANESRSSNRTTHLRQENLEMKLPKNIATVLLAIYLILAGLGALGVGFPLMGVITGVCALLAGILLLVGR